LPKKNPIEGKIASLDEDFDNATCTYYWGAVVWFETDSPDLKLGKCKVIQDS